MIAENFVEVVATVRAWPADQRLALVQEIVESLRTPSRPARPRTLDRAVGLLRRPGPAPTDEECGQMIEEGRLAKLAPMKVLLDTNVLLDVLLDRDPWATDAKAVWKACEDGKLTGFVSAVSFINIHYIARRLLGTTGATEAMSLLLDAFDVAPIGREVLERACQLSGTDFENDVQIAAALRSDVDAIVTRDQTGFASAPVPILTPRDLLASLT